MMKNKLDKRIDEALAESPCDEWWDKYLCDAGDIFAGRVVPVSTGALQKLISEAQRRERERIDQKVRTDISTALATAERNMDSFDPKHPRCPKCGKLMAEMEPHVWMCACSPKTRLSIG
jgi:hypothetical protein